MPSGFELYFTRCEDQDDHGPPYPMIVVFDELDDCRRNETKYAVRHWYKAHPEENALAEERVRAWHERLQQGDRRIWVRRFSAGRRGEQ